MPTVCALHSLSTRESDQLAIHLFRGHTVYEQFEFGNFYDHVGVPNEWGFLLFCAGWTLLGAIFLYFAGIMYPDSAFIGYIRVAVEAVALLSWLAGFIAVAVNISQNCPSEENGCGTLKAATVFGAVEWLLFVVTTTLTTKLVLGGTRARKSTSPSMRMKTPITV